MIQFLQQISCQEGKDKKGTNRDLKDIYFTKKKKKNPTTHTTVFRHAELDNQTANKRK